MANKKAPKGIGIYVAMLVVLMLLATFMFTMNGSVTGLKYFEVLDLFEQKQVEDFVIDLDKGDLTMEVTGKEEPIKYKLPDINLFLKNVDIVKYREEYNAQNPPKGEEKEMTPDVLPPSTPSILFQMLPTLLLLGVMVFFWVMMMRQAGGGSGKMMNFGKAKVKPVQDGKKVTFKEVAGADEEKEELEEIVEFLKNASKFNNLGARVPKGVLLMGPPGTGKTLLAKAVAGEAGVPFFSISGSDFVEMFVGVGASRVRDLFTQAKQQAPAIIFIDEIDAVGRHRGAGLGGGHDEREQTLNQLLVEMDGFGENSGIIVIAATNRRDILDPALLRPGRFDRQVVVGYPDVKGREAILKVHSRNKPIAPDVDLRVIAQTTAGFTGADLENLLNEAALLASRRDRRAIAMIDIKEATIKVVAGPEKKSHVVTEKDKKLTAYHESGHAVVTYFCEHHDPVHQVSIIPRGMAGGYTMSLPEEDKSYVTKKEMFDEIVTLLGGRVAEQLILEDISTGASNDLERSSKIARNMVTKYGFNEKLGPIVYGDNQSEVFLGRDIGHNRNYSETVAAEIDNEIRIIVDKAYEKTTQLISDHMDLMHKLAKYLIEFEKIEAAEFKRLMEGDDSVFEEARASMDAASASELPKDSELKENDDKSSEKSVESADKKIECAAEEIEIKEEITPKNEYDKTE